MESISIEIWFLQFQHLRYITSNPQLYRRKIFYLLSICLQRLHAALHKYELSSQVLSKHDTVKGRWVTLLVYYFTCCTMFYKWQILYDDHYTGWLTIYDILSVQRSLTVTIFWRGTMRILTTSLLWHTINLPSTSNIIYHSWTILRLNT